MQSVTTIDLPTSNPPDSRFRVYQHHVDYRVTVPNCTFQIAADEPEQIATWLERLAADVRTKAFEQTLTAVALGQVQDHVSTGADDG